MAMARSAGLAGLILAAALALGAPGMSGPRAVAAGAPALSSAAVVACRFAPVFVQKTSKRQGEGKEFEDFFVRLDFDGDANGFDNWENLARCPGPKCDLRAFVYGAVRETQQNYYLHYSYFHPRDPKRFFGHENDLEGAMVVVRKRADGTPPDGTDIALVQVQAHNRWDYGRPTGICMAKGGADLGQAACGQAPHAERTHVVLVSQVGRNWWFDQGHGTEIPSRPDFGERFLAYVPWTPQGTTPANSGDAGDPRLAAGRPVTYVLLPFSGDANGDGKLDDPAAFGDPPAPGPWDRRRDVRIYGTQATPPGHGLQGDDGCKANTPWGWTGGGIATGTFFLAPAQGEAYEALKAQGVVEDRDAGFAPDPYWKDSDLDLFPPKPAGLACNCLTMWHAFAYGCVSSDPLPAGPPCGSKPAPAPPAERVLERSAFDTCAELRSWVPDEGRELVAETVDDGSERCALRIPAGMLLRWPRSAEDLPIGTAPALWLPGRQRIVGLRVHARAVDARFPLGGFSLQARIDYDESLERVPFFRPAALGPERTPIQFLLDAHPEYKAGLPPAAFVISPDPSETLAPGRPYRVAPGQPWEVDRIELLSEKERR